MPVIASRTPTHFLLWTPNNFSGERKGLSPFAGWAVSFWRRDRVSTFREIGCLQVSCWTVRPVSAEGMGSPLFLFPRKLGVQESLPPRKGGCPHLHGHPLTFACGHSLISLNGHPTIFRASARASPRCRGGVSSWRKYWVSTSREVGCLQVSCRTVRPVFAEEVGVHFSSPGKLDVRAYQRSTFRLYCGHRCHWPTCRSFACSRRRAGGFPTMGLVIAGTLVYRVFLSCSVAGGAW